MFEEKLTRIREITAHVIVIAFALFFGLLLEFIVGHRSLAVVSCSFVHPLEVAAPLTFDIFFLALG